MFSILLPDLQKLKFINPLQEKFASSSSRLSWVPDFAVKIEVLSFLIIILFIV